MNITLDVIKPSDSSQSMSELRVRRQTEALRNIRSTAISYAIDATKDTDATQEFFFRLADNIASFIITGETPASTTKEQACAT